MTILRRQPRVATGAKRPPSTERRRPRFFAWVLAAAAIAALGCAASVFAGLLVAHNADVDDDLGFERSAQEISSRLRVAIEREEDLAVSTGAFVATNPTVTTAELAEWITSVRATERYPELLAVAAMAYVPQAELAEFLDRMEDDPAVPLNDAGQLEVAPTGARPFYCLLQAVVTIVPGTGVTPFGLDYCVGAVSGLVLGARDSGEASSIVVPTEETQELVVQTPIYRGGVVPETLEGRRADYIGSLGTSLAPEALLAGIADGSLGETISLTFSGGQTPVSFGDNPAADGVETITEDLGNDWTVEVSRTASSHNLVTTPTALALTVAGSVASLMLGFLVFTLGTGRKRAMHLVARRTEELHHQALHDALTGLPNRSLIVDRVEQMLARCRRDDRVGAVLFLDLDGFKGVNDTLGHDAGDQLLRAVTDRLTTSLRGIDTTGRLGGDEFVVLVEGTASQSDATSAADRILELMREPFELELAPAPIVLSASIGIATGDREVPGDLLRDADIALYQAKSAGRNCYRVFHLDMEAAVQYRYELESDLRSALDNDQFVLHYQPIYDLSDLSIVGAEALIRWEHPTRGLIQPDDFIPLLEASGQIVEVGRWVLFNACRQAKGWLDNGDDLAVSVNVSGRQLERDDIVDDVRRALEATTLDPARLTVEITETVLMDDRELTARRLHALSALGVRIAIDDFGTGYSSLAYLQGFPVDCLKIDRTFTNASPRTPASDAMISTLVQLGKDLGLQTLAEGVETTGQLDQLRGVDVDQGQGFLLARPLPPAAFESQLLLRSSIDTPTRSDREPGARNC